MRLRRSYLISKEGGFFVLSWKGTIEHLNERQIVFDTNRSWCAMLPALAALYPSSRVICCVRNPAWILNSFESLVQRTRSSFLGSLGQISRGMFTGALGDAKERAIRRVIYRTSGRPGMANTRRS